MARNFNRFYVYRANTRDCLASFDTLKQAERWSAALFVAWEIWSDGTLCAQREV